MIEWEAKITGLVEGEKFKYKRKVDNDFEYLDDEDEDKHIQNSCFLLHGNKCYCVFVKKCFL